MNQLLALSHCTVQRFLSQEQTPSKDVGAGCIHSRASRGLKMAPLKAQVDTLKILLHPPPLQEPQVPGRLLGFCRDDQRSPLTCLSTWTARKLPA